MAATADGVIIGGGATGASIAYHLAGRGLTGVVATLVVEGKTPAADVHAFRLSRFAEGKPIRGTCGDWLMC